MEENIKDTTIPTEVDTDTVEGNSNKVDNVEEVKTFTQEQLDKIVKDRIARATKPYSDYDELLAFKKQAEEKAEAQRLEQLSEVERINEQLKLEREQRERAEKLAAETAIRNEFNVKAASIGVATDRLSHAYKLVVEGNDNIKFDGEKVEGIETAIETIQNEMSYLIKKETEKKQPIGTAMASEKKATISESEKLKALKQKAADSGSAREQINFLKQIM